MIAIPIAVPDGERGPWRVETFTIDEHEAAMSRIRAFQHPMEAVEVGTYKRLMRDGEVVMSNTQMEIRTHREAVYRAKGHVLLNGLGLGMVLTAILAKPAVERVTVIEIDPDVIALVGPTFLPDPRVEIIEADAFKWRPPKGGRYQAVWHDIWPYICGDNLPEMHRLHRKYGRRADWQGSWCRYECERG